MTRFFVSVTCDEALVNVIKFAMMANFPAKKTGASQVSTFCIYNQENHLTNALFEGHN